MNHLSTVTHVNPGGSATGACATGQEGGEPGAKIGEAPRPFMCQDTALAELGKARQQVADAQAASDRLRDELAAERAWRAAEQQRNETLSADMESLRSQLASAEAAVGQHLAAARHEERKRLKGAMKLYKSRLAELKATCAALRAKNASLQSSYGSPQRQLREVRAENQLLAYGSENQQTSEEEGEESSEEEESEGPESWRSSSDSSESSSGGEGSSSDSSESSSGGEGSSSCDEDEDAGEAFLSEDGTGIADGGESAIFAAYTGSSLRVLASQLGPRRNASE